jgi:succinylglutamate desuccinylase
MRVEKLGDGKPGFAIVGCVHGDEPCGKKAIERLKQSDYEFNSAIKLVIANEKAYANDVRYIHRDLNRVFPGNKNSEIYEERIAAQLVDELQGLKVLDLHSTQSTNKIFAATSVFNHEFSELVKASGANYLAYFDRSDMDVLMDHLQAISIETGFQKSEEAAENAYETILNFLAYFDVIDEDYKPSEPEIFRVEERVDRPEVEFKASNFEKVEEGDIYAEGENEKLKAEEDFYPVLMSTDGYDDILGYKAKKFK